MRLLARAALPRRLSPLPWSLGVRAFVALLVVTAIGAPVRADDEELARWKRNYDEKILPIIRDRCLECHNEESAEGEFNLAKFDSADAAAAQLDIWDRVGKRIRLNEMPPAGSPGLSDPEKGAFYQWLDSRPKQDLCNELASDETQAWYRGHVMARRLTRTEYTNALQDLLGVDLPDEISLPSDGSGGEGFDTTGDSLFTSPIHVESYLRAADCAIEQVVAGEATGADWLALDQELTREHSVAILERFLRRAWRRPVTEVDLERLMTLYDGAIDRGQEPLTALSQPLKAALVSPQFLFVVERESEAGGVQRLSPHELAMRLSLFLWSSIPDEPLLDLADSGAIYEEQVVREQVARMLDDPRSERLGANFGLQWLGLTDLDRKVQPDAEVFPDFDPVLVEDFRREAILLVASVFRENRSVMSLIDSNSAILNRRLAEHYGLPNVEEVFADQATGDTWREVAITDGRRGGVLTMGAVLASTSYPRRTSPVIRGQWILSEVLGSAVPPPPPGVPALEEVVEDESPKTFRERLQIHRDNPQCASCHDRMDPLGFGLENFDPLGRWRDTENGLAIDASGTLPSGKAFEGPAELKKLVAERGDEFRKHFVRKLLGFALGRQLNKFDQCVIDDCLEQLAANEDSAACLIETICLSYPFQHRYFKAPEGAP